MLVLGYNIVALFTSESDSLHYDSSSFCGYTDGSAFIEHVHVDTSQLYGMLVTVSVLPSIENLSQYPVMTT